VAEKDILEKILMSHADVFADCVNALVYGGRHRLKAGDLCPAPTESFYRGRRGMRNQFCDVSFWLVEDGRIVLQYIIGNETRLRKRQILRKASYQGGIYRSQLEGKEEVYPVIGTVLDWTGKRSRIPLSLPGLLAQGGASREDLELVDEMKLTVWHMRNLSPEVRSRFVSDLGFVVDYLNEGNFEGRKGQRILHGEALCEMMEALTWDTRFTALIEKLQSRQEKGDEIVMCEYIDMLEARGEERGEERGMIKGENRLAALLTKLYALGRDEDARLALDDRQVRLRLYEELCIG